MEHLVTGATGFIGRFVVAELLQQPDCVVHALVRKGSEHKLDQIRQQLGSNGQRLRALSGDLTQPGLGLSRADQQRLRGKIRHLYHLAAIYDLQADADSQQQANVEGTRHALQAARTLQVDCFQHASSIAVAGLYPGQFTEAMFEEGTDFNNPYFLTKHLAEKCVRDEADVPYRIYRPSMVVGDSRSGAMDKIDGPYYIFRLLELVGRFVPAWAPLPGLEGGQFNIVPVDYVAKAMVHIAHQPDLDGQCFFLTDDRHYSLAELINLIAEVSGLPGFRWAIPNRALDKLPASTIPTLARQWWMKKFLLSLDIAPDALGFITYKTTFDRSNAAKALAGSGISPPPLPEYLPRLWQYWRQHLSPQRPQARIENHGVLLRKPSLKPYLMRARDHWKWNTKRLLHSQQALHDRVAGKTILLTGASSGIGAQVAHQLAAAGATLILVARSKDKLDAIAEQIQNEGGTAFVYATDLTVGDSIDQVCQQILKQHGGVDILINNAGRSIRRSIKFSLDRFHDYERTMQLNYYGSVRMALNLLPGMLERGDGHIVNVSTVGVQANPARFSAYLGSKWALEGWSWVAANELAHTGVTVSTINYPLVRTPMIAPTKIYDYTPAMSPETAVNWMLDIIITRNKRKVGPLGLGALTMYYLLPKTAETIVNASYQAVYEAPPEPRAKTARKQKRKAPI